MIISHVKHCETLWNIVKPLQIRFLPDWDNVWISAWQFPSPRCTWRASWPRVARSQSISTSSIEVWSHGVALSSCARSKTETPSLYCTQQLYTLHYHVFFIQYTSLIRKKAIFSIGKKVLHSGFDENFNWVLTGRTGNPRQSLPRLSSLNLQTFFLCRSIGFHHGIKMTNRSGQVNELGKSLESICDFWTFLEAWINVPQLQGVAILQSQCMEKARADFRLRNNHPFPSKSSKDQRA